MPFLSTSLLSQTIDDHIEWMATWSRCAFYGRQSQISRTEALQEPESFAQWRREAARLGGDQPLLEKLGSVFDQLHRQARTVFLTTPEERSVSLNDYNAVVIKYQELIAGLRKIERGRAATEQGRDMLTGLRTRIGMRDDINRELNRFLRTGKPFCLALADIDYFKRVNETYGQENGDKVLASVCNYISRSVRPFDEVWRWGGEEVLICLKEVDLRTGRTVLDRIRHGLEVLPIKLLDGREVTVTASFGLVTVDDQATVDGLLVKVDKALCAAKKEGRNCVEAPLR